LRIFVVFALPLAAFSASACSLDLGHGLVPSSGPSAKAGGTEGARLSGMTAAHNAVRAGVDTSKPLPDLAWSAELAEVAQAYAEHIAGSCELVHSHGQYGENLALFGGRHATADTVVSLWADEGKCWTFGPFMKGDQCSSSCTACGHYTQLVWRNTELVGCGVADCAGSGQREIWVCNYDPPGNFIGQNAY
jgi:pathogenesis-related protein 1